MEWIENTKTEATRVVDEWTDIDGRKHRVIEREQISEPLNLGSINHPRNTDIISIKIDIPRDISKNLDKFKAGFFKMFK